MTPRTIGELEKFKKDENIIIRIDGEDFREMLLEDESIEVNGQKRFFQGVPIGEGVFKVRLLPKEWDPLYGTIRLDERSDWITKGSGLVLKKTCCK